MVGSGGLFGVFNGWELIVVILIFIIVIGPQRLPEYTKKAVHWVRDLRQWADSSKQTLEDEIGVSVDELKKYDPRQYDPRKIIREAWDSTGLEDDVKEFSEVVKSSTNSTKAALTSVGAAAGAGATKEAKAKTSGTPFDPEAT